MSDNAIGLFTVGYNVTTGLAGAPNLALHLAVNTPKETVNGTAQITQATNPPLDMHASVWGDFTYMTVMPNSSSILVTATGAPAHSPIHGPVFSPTLHLRMVLADDWQSGTASFRYTTDGMNWETIQDCKVTKI